MARPEGSFKFTPDELELAWQQYFEWCDNTPWLKNEAVKSGDAVGTIIKVPVSRPYTEAGFCAFHDLGISYIKDLWSAIKDRDDKDSKRYSTVITRARAKCYAQKFEGAAVGAFNANIIARDLGLAEKTESEVKQEIKIKPDLSKLSLDELKSLREINKKISGE